MCYHGVMSCMGEAAGSYCDGDGPCVEIYDGVAWVCIASSVMGAANYCFFSDEV